MERDLYQTMLRDIIAFASGRRADGATLLVTWPNVDKIGADEVGPLVDQADEYLSVSVLPISPDTRGITTGWSIYGWLIQVDVAIRAGASPLTAIDHIDALRTTYPKGRRIEGRSHTFQLIRHPSVASPISDGGRFIYPVTLRVQTIV